MSDFFLTQNPFSNCYDMFLRSNGWDICLRLIDFGTVGWLAEPVAVCYSWH